MKRLIPLIFLAGCGVEGTISPPPPDTTMAPLTTATIATVPVTPTTAEVAVGLPPIPTTPPTTMAPLVAEVTGAPMRLPAEQATDTLPPPPTTTTLPPIQVLPSTGGCAQWAGILYSRGATADDVAFFVDGGILKRESACGYDMLNDESGDSGPCQINPIHNKAGYFGGRYFGDGGWLGILHGRRTRQDLHNVQWVDACLTLRKVCGNGPWQPPYSCANRRVLG